MSRTACALLCVIFLLSLCSPGSLRKTSHSYPRGGGLSGTGHHGHSSSGNIRPSYSAPSYTHQSQSHNYPPSGTGGNRPTYPNSNGGLSGTGTGHQHPSSGGSPGSHTYPSSGGSPGSHAYPASPGLSGTNQNRPGSPANVNPHYNYKSQQIYYPSRSGPSYSYPVYHSSPPSYVYHYRDSSSKYGTLLAGLALFNLGMLTSSAFSHHNNRPYQSQPGEVCKLGIKKENGDYEETKIKCDLISSFIWADEEKRKTAAAKNSTTSVTTTVTNTTTMNITNNDNSAPPAPLYMMLPNGTLAEVNATLNNVTQPNGALTTLSVTTVTTTNTTTVSDALDPKNNGPPVKVTDGTQCYVIRRTPSSNMRHTIPCGLLQTYASTSLKNAAARNIPLTGVLIATVIAFIMR